MLALTGLLVGCQAGEPTFSWLSGKPADASQSPPAASANQGVSVNPAAAGASTPPQETAPDSDLSLLEDRIARYAGRFPDGTPASTSERDSPQADAASSPAASRPSAAASDPPGVPVGLSHGPVDTHAVDPSTITEDRQASPRPVPMQTGPQASLPSLPGLTRGSPEPDAVATVDRAALSPNMPVNIGPAGPQASSGTRTDAVTTEPLQAELLEIRPVAAASPSPPETSANMPAAAGAPPRPVGLAELIPLQEARVQADPRSSEEQLRLRLLYLAAGQAEKALEPVVGPDSVQAELLTALLRAAALSTRSITDPRRGSAEALEATLNLHRLLSRQAPVMITRMALVTGVRSFGDYDEVQPARFDPGRPVHVFCYVEIANFHSQPTDDGRLRTLLGARCEVFDSTGQRVWERGFGRIEDRTRSPRRDFFVPLEIRLPAGLPPGEYLLKVTIEDQLGATSDQHRLSFRIGR